MHNGSVFKNVRKSQNPYFSFYFDALGNCTSYPESKREEKCVIFQYFTEEERK